MADPMATNIGAIPPPLKVTISIYPVSCNRNVRSETSLPCIDGPVGFASATEFIEDR